MGLDTTREQYSPSFGLLQAEDWNRLLEWNDTDNPDFLRSPPVSELVDATCRTTPDAIALTFGNKHVSYQGFRRAVSKLAARLQQENVGPERIVVVFMERSLEMVIAIHAIFRAGGVYLPLDPAHPPARTRTLVRKSRADHILTDAPWRQQLPAGLDAGILTIQDCLADPAPLPEPSRRLDPGQAAYILYTSGSTGTPKGVVNTSAGLVNRLLWMQAHYPLRPDDVVLHKTPISFDVSVWELCWPLLVGAKLTIAAPADHRDPALLVDRTQADGVTVCHFVPSFMAAWAGRPDLDRCRSLRHLFSSGEALSPTLARDLEAQLPAQIHNLYGPTEAAIDVTYWDHVPGQTPTRLPIGKPIANIAIHVLDPYLDPLPVGHSGDLHIAGIGLARGYLNNPRLTATAFLPAPYSNSAGQRMYRTGDVGRWLSTGNLDFLGRADREVKIRGIRVDLGEVESTLARHSDVAMAVVVAKPARARPRRVLYEGLPSEPDTTLSAMRPFLRGALVARESTDTSLVLAAWVQPRPEARARLVVPTLRQWMADQVPDHLVPSLWAVVDTFPLMENGKLNSDALVEPTVVASDLHDAPATETEAELCSIWADTLEIPPPGPMDNFFALGGDSLLALRIVATAAERGIHFSVAKMLAAPTVRELALLAQHQPRTPAPDPIRPFELCSPKEAASMPADVVDAYPLATIQAGLIFHDEADHGSEVYKEAFIYRVEGPFDEDAFRRAVDLVTRDHEILRTSVDLENFAQPMQLVHRNVAAKVVVEHVQTGPGESLSKTIATHERRRAMRWNEPPFVRFRLRVFPDGNFEIYLIFHDLLLDGWSASLLVIDLLRTYDGLLSQVQKTRERPHLRFADYIGSEIAARDDPEAAAFFAATLASAPALRFPVVPSAEPTGSVTDRYAVLDVGIPSDVSAGLRRVSIQLSVALKHVLLAVHMRVMSHLFGSLDVVSGLEVNGRLERADSERVLGMHLNTVPMRLQLRSGTWRNLILRVAKAEQELWPYRRYPYAKLQESLGQGRLTETVFNYVHFHVFRDLAELRHIRLTAAGGYGASHFPFRAEFSLDPFSARVHLCLECNRHELGVQMIHQAGDCYRRALGAVAASETDRYDAEGLFDTPPQSARTDTTAQDPVPWLDHLEFWAGHRPNRVALTCGNRHITFGALFARATTIAGCLIAHGIGPESIVAIRLRDPIAEVLAIVATQIAGGAYLPVSRRLPPMALEQVLRVAHLLVCDAASDLTKTRGCLQSVDFDGLTSTAPSVSPGAFERNGSHLAYVMFTSGSTGAPRGVMISQSNLSHSLESRLRTYPMQGDEAFLLVPSLASDSSVAVVFSSLAGGGRLVLREARDDVECHELEGLIARHGITDILLTPSLHAVLVSEAAAEALASLRRVIVAGDVAHATLADAHRQAIPGASLINEYGPTEATVWSTVGTAKARITTPTLPIGVACDHCQVRLVDGFDLPTMQGQAGEVLIGGSGIARGYLADPKATAARFRPDSMGNGARTYHTGDMARQLVNGSYEFLGRRDRQVSINGFRLELAEVEDALLSLPDVREAAVTAHDQSGRTVLSAFVVPAPAAELDQADVLGQLRTRLPRHAIPTECAIVRDLPKNPNNKIDYRHLARKRIEIQRLAALEKALTHVEALSTHDVEAALAALGNQATP